ncbi:MAG: metallophosphoesterase family protein [Chloroflexota bacterium]
MTRIVVLADTHMPRKGRTLPSIIFSEIERSSFVIHLGDFTGMEVVNTLRDLAPLHAVHGNNDSDDIRALFPAARTMVVETFTIGMLHGHIGGRTAVRAAENVRACDIVLFGHSHASYAQRDETRLLFNPGSPTDRRWSAGCSFGILDLQETIEATIVNLPPSI